MVAQIIDGIIHGVLNDSCLRISFLLPLLFANVTVVVHCSVMLCQVISIVEPLIEAELTIQMVRLLMLMVLIPPVELLLEKQNWLVLNT